MKSNDKRRCRKNYHNFSIYLYKLLREVTQDKIGRSRSSVLILNNFINDMMEKIAHEEEKMTIYSSSQKNTH